MSRVTSYGRPHASSSDALTLPPVGVSSQWTNVRKQVGVLAKPAMLAKKSTSNMSSSPRGVMVPQSASVRWCLLQI